MMSVKIRDSRLELGLTQPEFSALIGISARAISNLERGETMPKAATIRKLAEVCKKPVSWFYEETMNSEMGNGCESPIVPTSNTSSLEGMMAEIMRVLKDISHEVTTIRRAVEYEARDRARDRRN